MPLFKRYSLYAAGYLAAGLIILYAHYLRTSPYNKEALDEKINLAAASHFQMSALVDNLPTLFKENPHAAALKISDLKGAFWGAMYDARRMTGTEYKTFLDTKFFDPKNAPLPGFELHVWESKRRRLRIVVLSLARATFGEYLSFMGRDYALHYIIPLYLILGALGLTAFHFFYPHHKGGLTRVWKKQGPTPSAPHVPKPIQPRPQARPAGHAWRLKSGVLTESSIQSTLSHLGRIAGAPAVALYARSESGRLFTSHKTWYGVAEVRGSITVRGEGMETPAELANPEGASEIIESADRRSWFFFNSAATQATLCFVFTYPLGHERMGTDLTADIAATVKAKSRALVTQHSYENSILDSETGLYSAPYALFSLKEKMRAGQKFSVAAFEFGAADFSGDMSAKTVRTAIRILRENFEAEAAPVVARADERTILIIFNTIADGTASAEKTVRELHKAYSNLGRPASAVFIPDASVCGSSQRVLRTLEQQLSASSGSGRLEIYSTYAASKLV